MHCNECGRWTRDSQIGIKQGPRNSWHPPQRHPPCPPLPASRRAPGGNGAPRGPRSLHPEPPRKAAAPNPSSPPAPNEVVEPEQFAVPSVGWMWRAGSAANTSSGDGASTSSAGTSNPTRNMPSAASTVANLYEDHIKAKKSLGQNFVTDDGVLLDIVAAAAVGPDDLVLEVGPGTGNLTKHLLARGAHVTAVEKDDTLYDRLRNEYRDVEQLTLVRGDALKVGLEDIIRGMVQQKRMSPAGAGDAAAAESTAAGPSTSTSTSGPGPASTGPITAATVDGAHVGGTPGSPGTETTGAATAAASGVRGRKAAGGGARASGRKVKVVANLPYNITKDLITMLLPLGDVISDLHIMIQHEAAVRLTERTPGGPEWRAANIRTLFYCKPRYRFRISRFKYDPVPGVDGALATFSLLPPSARLAVPSERAFHALVTKGFSERRKKLRNSVQPLYTSQQVEAALRSCELNVDARAQDLTLEQFTALSWQLHRMQVEEGLGLLQGAAGQEQGASGQGQGAAGRQ